MNPEEKLVALLSQSVIIAYSPKSHEPDYQVFLESHTLPGASFVVSADPSVSPFDTADELSKKHSSSVAVFVPGVAFDMHGTRHGRGRGWYDRFLSRVPKAWIRVGVADSKRFMEKLVRETWDEPMDFLLIFEEQGFSVKETSARQNMIQS